MYVIELHVHCTCLVHVLFGKVRYVKRGNFSRVCQFMSYVHVYMCLHERTMIKLIVGTSFERRYALCQSIGKTGTHTLMQCISLIPRPSPHERAKRLGTRLVVWLTVSRGGHLHRCCTYS